jgi:phosphopantothenoylcysteine synthetase/decarboxylase
MWLNAATQENVATLRSRGSIVIDPADGRRTLVRITPSTRDAMLRYLAALNVSENTVSQSSPDANVLRSK